MSLIVPIYNEILLLDRLRAQLVAFVDSQAQFRWEIIFVDNRSSDGTLNRLVQWVDVDERVVVVRMTRNFGPNLEPSIQAGLLHARGDAAVVLYADLQEPLATIPEMLQRWMQGFDVVHGVQIARDPSTLPRRLGARLYYSMIESLGPPSMVAKSNDFKLLSRRAVDAYCSALPRFGVPRIDICQIGLEQTSVSYSRAARPAGESKVGILDLLDTAIRSLTLISFRPLIILSLYSGIMFAALLVGTVLVGAAGVAWIGPLALILPIIAVLMSPFYAGVILLPLYVARLCGEIRHELPRVDYVFRRDA